MSKLRNILDTIRKGVEFAEGLAPALALIPGAGPILATATKAAGAVSEIIENVQERITERKIVASTEDEQELKGYAQRLSAINDDLERQVNES